MFTPILFENARVLDADAGRYEEDRAVLIEDGRIASVTSEVPAALPPDTRRIDVAGKTLMPGLCDAHVHVIASTANFKKLMGWAPSYVTAKAGEVMAAMLWRGFTTVRDVGGADFGIAQAVEEDLLDGPRLLFGGRALSQTGGHGDFRGPGENLLDDCLCCAGMGRVCDGVAEVQKAARDELRRGAHHVKIMASGGVSSPTDRIDSTQFSLDEMRAIVDECEAANRYACAHAYTARAVNRALQCGVRSIEHGNLIDAESCAIFKEKDAFLVPTLSTYRALVDEGVEAGMPAELVEKTYQVLDAGLEALALAHARGVRIVFGTDLLGDMHRHQLNEFNIRAQVQSTAEILRSATVTAAELFQMEGDIGRVAEGHRADLLVVDGDPLDDLTVMTRPESALKLVMKDGKIYRDELS